MKKCPTCGFDIEDSVSFCPECGANVQNISNHPTNNNSQTNENDSLRAKFENENSNAPLETNNNVFETNPNQNVYNTMPNQTSSSENQNFAGTYQPTSVQYPNQINAQPQDKANIGFAILSWFIPLFGWIYWGTKKNEKPKAAKTCGIVATISFAINILLSIIGTIIAGAGAFATIGALDSIIDENNYSYSDTFDDDDWNDFVESYGDVEKSINTETTKVPETTTSKAATAPRADISSKWTDYVVSINGTKITLPCSWSDFNSKTGFDFKDSDDRTTTLKDNQYTTSVIIEKNGQKIAVRFINTSGSQKTLSECQVAAIKADSFYEPTADIVFAGGIKVGDKADITSLKRLFGEPTRVYDSDNSDYHIYTYEDDKSLYNEIEIIISDGKVKEISLEHFDF